MGGLRDNHLGHVDDDRETLMATWIDGIKVGEVLGHGGYATVYACDLEGQAAAIKVAHRSSLELGGEASALNALRGPGVVELIGHGIGADGREYLLMPRLVGLPLDEHLASHRSLSPTRAVELFTKVARALESIHQGRWLHLDLKPHNVWLHTDDSVTLFDFGLAAPLEAVAKIPRRDPKLGVGTPQYMAPEQVDAASRVDERTDIYALGVLLFELLSGRAPFVRRDDETVAAQQVSRRPPKVSQFSSGVSPELDRLVARMLCKEPDGRPCSIDAILRALEELPTFVESVGKTDVAETATSTPTTSAHEVRRLALLAIFGELDAARVNAVAAPMGGVLAHIGADDANRHLVLVFEADSEAASLRAAVRMARAERADGVACVVHLAEVRIRRRSKRVVVRGPEIATAQRWLQQPERGTISATTTAMARLPRSLVRPRVGQTGATIESGVSLTHATHTRTIPLRGREQPAHQLKELLGSMDRGAVLYTASAEIGHGKTRLCTEAQRIAQTCGLRVLHLDGSSGRSGERAFLRALVDEGRERAPSISFFLGEIGPDDPAIKSVLAIPGGLRQQGARAIADAMAAASRDDDLAVVIDNLHLVDHALLDAIEIATLSENGARLAVVATCAPTFHTTRPNWGSRNNRYVETELGALERAAAMDLARDLLAPAQFIPQAVLDRLWDLSSGVPLELAELAAAIRLGGGVRERQGTGTWYVAAGALLSGAQMLDASPGTSAFELLAARALERLPAPICMLLEVITIMGDGVTVSSLGEMIELAIEDGVDVGDVDPSFAVASLARGGVLKFDGHRQSYRFRHPLLRVALEKRIDRKRRRRLHELALRRPLDRGDDEAVARFAHHAIAAGDIPRGASLLVELGDRARTTHRYLTAADHYSAVLDHRDAPDYLREMALFGRGRTRHYVYQESEAETDLAEATELAMSRADEHQIADILLFRADVADCLMDWLSAAALLETAEPLVARCGDPNLAARAKLRRGVVEYRRENLAAAQPLLEQAADAAKVLGDAETEIVALLVLATLLTYRGDFSGSKTRFELLIARCIDVGDRKNLGFAYSNRCELWTSLRDHDRAVKDAEKAAQLARELGNPLAERVAAHNLAELLYYAADYQRALELAKRSRELDEGLSGDSSPADPLLLARIHSAVGDLDEARSWLSWAREHCATSSWLPSQDVLATALELRTQLSLDADTDPIMRAAERASDDAQTPQQRIELLWLLASSAHERGLVELAKDLATSGTELAGNDQMWAGRFAHLCHQACGPSIPVL